MSNYVIGQENKLSSKKRVSTIQKDSYQNYQHARINSAIAKQLKMKMKKNRDNKSIEDEETAHRSSIGGEASATFDGAGNRLESSAVDYDNSVIS